MERRALDGAPHLHPTVHERLVLGDVRGCDATPPRVAPPPKNYNLSAVRRRSLHQMWRDIDMRFMKPVFGGRGAPGCSSHHRDRGDEDEQPMQRITPGVAFI